jgi:hypothetical protein
VSRHPEDRQRLQRARRRTIALATAIVIGCLLAAWQIVRGVADGDFATSSAPALP